MHEYMKVHTCTPHKYIIHTYIHTAHTNAYIYANTQMHAWIHMYTNACIHAYAYAEMHMYTHTSTQMQTHVHTQKLKQKQKERCDTTLDKSQSVISLLSG